MKTLLVAFDAGASAILAAYLKRQNLTEFILCVGGPAQVNLSRALPKAELHPIEMALTHLENSTPDRILTGSSWGTQIERLTWIRARELKIPSYGTFDGWGDYRNCLDLDGKRVEPDYCICFNQVARQSLLSLGIPQARILAKPNYYFQDLYEKVHALEVNEFQNLPMSNRILYVSENISTCEKTFGLGTRSLRGYSEFEALRYFFDLCRDRVFEREPVILLRPHPSDAHGKYDELKDEFSDLTISVASPEMTVEENLAWSTKVVGCESTVLYLAAELGRKTYSCLPPTAKIQCRVNHPRIIRMNQSS